MSGNQRFDSRSLLYHTPRATRLAYLAALVAVEAPQKRGESTNAARIPWSLIEEIRRELQDDGLDWRRASKDRAIIERRSR